jgi:microcystin-dependent protein
LKKPFYRIFLCAFGAVFLLTSSPIFAQVDVEVVDGRIVNVRNPIDGQDVANKNYVDNAIDALREPPAVLQSTGLSETAVMSQIAVTEAIAAVPQTQIVDTTGQSTTAVMSQKAVTNAILTKQTIFNMIYPVGAIYMSVNSTNPNSLFGGTWSLWGTGRVPVCINTSDSDFNSSEKTGGAKTVTLTTSQIPSHTHGLARAPAGSGFKESYAYTNMSVREQTTQSDATGGGSSHTNLQPYITCYMWKRTA